MSLYSIIPIPHGHLYLLHHLPDGTPILKPISVLYNATAIVVTSIKALFLLPPQFYTTIGTVRRNYAINI